MSTQPTKMMTYEEFFEEFKPRKNQVEKFAQLDGHLFEPYGIQVKEIDEAIAKNPNKVWTLIDTDGNWSIIPGIHRVNRMGYLITEKESPDQFMEVPYDAEDFFKNLKREGNLRSLVTHYELSPGMQEELVTLRAKWYKKTKPGA